VQMDSANVNVEHILAAAASRADIYLTAKKLLSVGKGSAQDVESGEFLEQVSAESPAYRYFSANGCGDGMDTLERPDLPGLSRLPDSIRSRIEGFAGRRHVFEAIDHFIGRERCGYFLLHGDPGEGKTAALARYVAENDSFCHFNSRTAGVTGISHFLESLQRQFGITTESESQAQPPGQVGRPAGNAVYASLNPAAQRKSADGRVVLVIDALDEVAWTDAGNILNLPPDLPVGAHVVLSSRRLAAGRIPLLCHCPFEVYDLADHQAACEDDIRGYLEQQLERNALRQWMERQGMTPTSFADVLLTKSELNFMYLRHVLPALENGPYKELSADDLPPGLERYYEDHWRRMKMVGNPPREKLCVLYTLCEAGEPSSRDALRAFLRRSTPQLDALRIQLVLDEWREFLHITRTQGEPRYSFYHASFREFLHRQDIVQAAGVDLNEIIGEMSAVLLDAWEGYRRVGAP